MKKEINKLRRALDGKNLSRDAQKRLINDLSAIEQRLLKDEYETCGIVQNIFDFSDKAKQLCEHLESYARIGRSWSQVLQNLPINKFPEIVDICPGYAPKVELALTYSGYQGNVVVLDKDRDAVKNLIKFMGLFDHSFSIRLLEQDLFLPNSRQFGFVIGNHVIDDLILYFFATQQGISMSTLYEKEGEFIKMWNIILENRQENLRIITSNLFTVLSSLVTTGGYLCLSQYKSYMERMLNLDESYLFSKDVFNMITRDLCDSGFVRVKLPGESLLGKRGHFSNREVVVLKK